MVSLLDQLKATVPVPVAGDELRHVDVPEWPLPDGKPTRVYFHKANIGDMREVQKSDPGDGVAQSIRLVVNKALDAEGKRLFNLADVTEIMTLDASLVIGFMTVSTAITGSAPTSKVATGN